jgi:Ca-activated chloride channel family protein
MKHQVRVFFSIALLFLAAAPARVIVQAQQTPPSLQQPEPPKPPSKSDDGPVLKTLTNLVTMNITVTDPQGRFVTGLEEDHFEIYDDKVRQKIEFFSDEDSPVSVGVIFDISGSMKGRIQRATFALRRFLETCHEQDEYFLVGFNTQARLITDFTGNPERISGELALAETKGSTALYDAAYIGVEKVRQGRHSRRALIIISDGQDNSSRYTFRELRQLVRETDVQIYCIGITNAFGNMSLDLQGQSILDELSRLTGGRAFFPTNNLELQEVITKVGLELRHQYSIGYTPSTVDAKLEIKNAEPGKEGTGRWHKIKVKLNAPKGLPTLTVRAKEGYFANFAEKQ